MTNLPAMDVASRLDRLRAHLDAAKCDALFITNLFNIRYLTGFSGSAALLLVTPDAALFTTDGRYDVQSHQQLAAADVTAEIVVGGVDAQKKAVVAAAKGIKRLGLEANTVTWRQQQSFADKWFDAELVSTEEVVEELRKVKDAGEQARVAAAAHAADLALAQVRDVLLDAPTEAEFALALDFAMREHGADDKSFDTIVAAGPNGAKAHHEPSDRRINEGELVVLDFGAIVDGYCSDMTRTLAVGEISGELQKMFDVVQESQAAGVAEVKAGNTCAQIDQTCRDVIAEAGWSDAFTHSTGHGVGLEIHEAPAVSVNADDVLQAGYVVTVEPGVYFPELGGVRIEDTVVVTDKGCDIVTNTPKDPLVRN